MHAGRAKWLCPRSRNWPTRGKVLEDSRSGHIRAYSLAVKAEKSIPGDPALAKLWPVISYQLSLETTPPGADVYRRDYDDTDSAWDITSERLR